MILDASLKLEAVLAGAVATTQPEVHVFYTEWNREGVETPPATYRVALNSASDVTILAAPDRNPIRDIKGVAIYNKDSASVTVTVKTDDGTTERIIFKGAVATLKSLMYERGTGWYVTTA